MEEKIQFVKDANLDGIELDFNHQNKQYPLADASYRSALKVLKEKYKTDFPALAINSLCEFGMSKAESWQDTRYAIEQGIVAAADLDVPIVQLPSFFGGDIVSDDDFNQTVKAIQFACDKACEHNIVIGSENALSGEKQLALIDRVARQNFKIYFDCRNSWWMKAIPSLPILEQVLPHICEVHLKDGVGQEDRFTLLGDGDVGVKEILATLKKQGYSHRILLENDYNQFVNDGMDALEAVERDTIFIKNGL